jgi:replicative DNA helicase
VFAYLQVVWGPLRGAAEGRVQEVSEITTGLKALAKELNIPILALSQLSRQVENRDDKRPQLADLRESGSIEQDADVVLFIYREEYYLSRKDPKPNTPEFYEWRQQMEEAHSVAEVIIAKQRHGPTGNVRVQFEDTLTKFQNLADEAKLPEQFN